MKDTDIPKGYRKIDVKARDAFLKNYLKTYKNNVVNCNALGGVPVLITQGSLDEIIEHAAKRYKSTICAMQLVSLIENAGFYRMTLPKPNKQVKKFGFSFMYELHSKTAEGFIAKIMIGVRVKKNDDFRFLEYCITEL